MTQPSTEEELQDRITEAYAHMEALHAKIGQLEAEYDEWDDVAWTNEAKLREIRESRPTH